MMASFRSILRWLVPTWLFDEITQSHALLLDEHMDRARAGLEARFPSRAQPDALTLIGQDRGIPRGRTETDEHYAQRLIGWRYPRGHRVRGSAFALLNQVSEYFGGIACWTIDVKGNRHERTTAGVESFSYGYAWNWDGTTSPKGRFWIVLDVRGAGTAGPLIGDPALWGGAIGGPGTIGTTGIESGDVAAIRRLFTGDAPWKPGGTMQQWAVASLDGSVPVPSGDWDLDSVRVALPQFRFWRLY